MKVTISSLGRFWAAEVAEEMQRRGALGKFYTGYPRSRMDRDFGDRLVSLPWINVPALLLGRRLPAGIAARIDRWNIITYDRWVASRIESCDVLHALSSFGLRSHRRVKAEFGAVTVCERASAHIRVQDEILAEEHRLWGVPYRHIDPVIVDRELVEYRECDRIFVPSTFVRDSFVARGVSAEKVKRVPFGVDLDDFRPVPKDDGVFRVVYVGTMSLQKGVPYLLEALGPLHEAGDLELWLIGPADREIEPFLARHDGQYRYFGPLPRLELYRYYSQGSVFCIGSVQDGLGMVVLQAMACGLPVIATENTGASDLFTDGVHGFRVPIRNGDVIRERVQQLMEDPGLRAEMSRAARERAQQFEGWGQYADLACSYYREALEERGVSNA